MSSADCSGDFKDRPKQLQLLSTRQGRPHDIFRLHTHGANNPGNGGIASSHPDRDLLKSSTISLQGSVSATCQPEDGEDPNHTKKRASRA